MHDNQVVRVELVSSLSSRKSNILYGYISTHLRSQGIWGVGSGAAALFGARTTSTMNSVGSRIRRLGSDETEEEQGMATSAETYPEGDNRDGEGGSIKIRRELQTRLSSLT